MRLLADTQVVIWYVLAPEELSTAAAEELAVEAAANHRVAVSAHSVVEITYAAEKRTNCLTTEDLAAIHEVLHDAGSPFEVLPVDLAVAERVGSVPRTVNADPGDRIVVATAEFYDLDIITSDRKIPAMTARQIIW